MNTSSRKRHGSTARWRDPTESTRTRFYRLLDGVVIDDSKVFNEKLREWEHFYNYARPHGALGGQTPYERLRQKTASDVTHPRQSHTNAWVARESNPEPTD